MSGPVPVYVGPRKLPLLEAAVREGGGAIASLQDARAIIYHGTDDPQEVIAMIHPGIEWVQLPHAGVERWTREGLVTTRPVWTSAVGAYASQVAEHALALLLAGARGLPQLARVGHWTERSTRSLSGSTIGLLGAGSIARALIGDLEPLRCRILAVANSGEVPGAERTVPRAQYRDILPECDYVVVSAPSTAQTRGMLGSAEFALMRPSAWLVNIARGDLVKTDELVTALQTGVIAGAALDVTDPEPLPDGHPLWSLDNVLITPHAANPEDAYWPSLVRRVKDNVERFAAGEPLLAVITPQSGF